MNLNNKILLLIVFHLTWFLSGMAQDNSFNEGVSFFESKNFDKAKTAFQKAVNNELYSRKSIEYLGDIAGYQKRWDDALKHYKTLLEFDDNNANYHFKYGGAMALKAQASNKMKALTMIGDFKKHLHRAAVLDVKHIEARWALVEVYVSLPAVVGGSEKKALKYANELLKLSPVDGYLSLGYVAEYNDRPQDAERHYRKAVEIGGSLHTYDKLSNLYEATNQPEKALENYEQATKKHQRNHLNYQIGKVCAQYNLSPQKGLQCLNTYLNNHSEKDGVPKAWAYLRIAQIYRQLKDKRNAYNAIQQALKELPDLKQAKKEKKQILLMPNKV